MSKNQQYQERVQRMVDVANGKIPDRVPVCALIESYALAYAGTTIPEVEGHILKHVKSYGKIYEDIYYDCAYVPYLTHSLKLGRTLGSEVFFASADGVTMQHKEDCPMVPEDYEDFMKDPVKWILDEFLPRKFPKFNTDNEGQKKAFLKSLPPFLEFAGTLVAGNFYFERALGMPVVVGGSAEMPIDMFFDFLRGFKGTVTDVRRYNETMHQAVEAVSPYCYDLMKMTHLMMTMPPHVKDVPWLGKYLVNSVVLGKEPQFKSFPWLLNPCHMAPFMSDKTFEEFYLQPYVDIATYIQSHGGHMFTVLEGEWGENKLNMLAERVPENAVTFVGENDDIRLLKKTVGQKNAIMGGMPLSLLRTGTKQECLDYAKGLLDDCAPGGRYIFSTDKVLLAPGDVNPENLKAVNEFVHQNGKY